MNKHLYQLIFDKRVGQLVAVGEHVVALGKAGGGESRGRAAGGALSGVMRFAALTPMALAAWLMCGGPAALAQVLPSGAQVVAGSSTVSTAGNTMTINQASQRSVINWNAFDVGAANTVQFVQPGASSQSLNRVVGGGGASQIAGSVLANGQVLIQNPNGLIFGAGSVVDTASLLATTKAISSAEFMAGIPLNLSATGYSGAIEARGRINASPEGYVILSADQVRHSGVIDAPQGTVVLAAGDYAVATLSNGQSVRLAISNATANALTENSGVIRAPEGKVLLTSRGAQTLMQTVVNLSGVIQAASGKAMLDGGDTGDVVMTGVIDVSGMSANATGGTAIIAGDRVGLFESARLMATGVMSGGSVIIGGDSLGLTSQLGSQGLFNSPTLANLTQVSSSASIDFGSARGNGGFLETSGRSLNIRGRIVGQAAGVKGSWLIDPTDITIGNFSTSGLTNQSGIWSGTGATAFLDSASLSGAINGNTDVLVTTASAGPASGNISVLSNIAKSSLGNATLTLIADGNISIQNSSIYSSAGPLGVNLSADGTIILSNSTILTAGANLSMQGGSPSSHVYGILINGGENKIDVGTGSANLSGTSFDGRGIQLGAASTKLSLLGDQVVLIGNSNRSSGTVLTNLQMETSGNVTIIGNVTNIPYISNDPYILNGILITGNVGITSSSGLTLIRGSSPFTGVQVLNSSFNLTAAGTSNIEADGYAFGVVTRSKMVGTDGPVGFSAVSSNLTISSGASNNVLLKGISTSALANTVRNPTAGLEVDSSSLFSFGNNSIHGEATNPASISLGFGIRYGHVNAMSGTLSITGIARGLNGAIEIGNPDYIGGGGTSTQQGAGLFLHGFSEDGPGILIGGSDAAATFTGDGTTDLVGTSQSGAGVEVQVGGISSNGNGLINISGTSDSGPGINLGGAASVSFNFANAKTLLRGISNSSIGIVLGNPNVSLPLSAVNSSQLEISGQSQSGTGVLMAPMAYSVNRLSSLSVSGYSDTGVGIVTPSASALTMGVNGNMTFNSSSDLTLGNITANNLNVQSGGNLSSVGNINTTSGLTALTADRNISLAGSVSALGLDLRAAVDVTVKDVTTAALSVNAGSNLSLTGLAKATGNARLTGNAVTIASTGNLTGDGTVNVTPNSSVSGNQGVNITGTNVSVGGNVGSGGGNVTIGGGNVSVDPGANVSANGSTNVTGNISVNVTPNSSVSGNQGVNVTGPNVAVGGNVGSGSGNVTIGGGNVTVDPGANVSANGSTNVTGNISVNVTPNSSVSGNQGVNITGTNVSVGGNVGSGGGNVTIGGGNVSVDPGANVSANGSTNVTGNISVNVTPNSSVSGNQGVNITGTNVSVGGNVGSGSGNVTIGGGNVTVDPGANVSANGTTNVSGNTSVNITPNASVNGNQGVNVTGTNVSIGGNVGSGSGNVTIGGGNVTVNPGANVSANGTTNVSGNTSVNIASNASVSGNQGTNVSAPNVAVNGSVSSNAGNVAISGSNVSLGNASNVTANGSTTLTGNVSLNVSENASVSGNQGVSAASPNLSVQGNLSSSNGTTSVTNTTTNTTTIGNVTHGSAKSNFLKDTSTTLAWASFASMIGMVGYSLTNGTEGQGETATQDVAPTEALTIQGSMTTDDGDVQTQYDIKVQWGDKGKTVTIGTPGAQGNSFGQAMTLVDSSGGVLRYRFEDARKLQRAELTINPQTKALFYREMSSSKNFRSHGWSNGPIDTPMGRAVAAPLPVSSKSSRALSVAG